MKLKVQGVEVSLLVLGFRGTEGETGRGKGRVWGGGGGNLHPDTDKHRSTSSPLVVMETATCCSQPASPRSLTKKQCSTTIVFPRKLVEWNRLFVPY